MLKLFCTAKIGRLLVSFVVQKLDLFTKVVFKYKVQIVALYFFAHFRGFYGIQKRSFESNMKNK